MSTSPAQTPRVKAVLDGQRAFGVEDDDWVWLERRDVLERVRVEGCLGGLFSPRYACVHPARLARGLAEVVERLGVRIYEGTPALSVGPGGVETPGGRLRADARDPRHRGLHGASFPVTSGTSCRSTTS